MIQIEIYTNIFVCIYISTYKFLKIVFLHQLLSTRHHTYVFHAYPNLRQTHQATQPHFRRRTNRTCAGLNDLWGHPLYQSFRSDWGAANKKRWGYMHRLFFVPELMRTFTPPHHSVSVAHWQTAASFRHIQRNIVMLEKVVCLFLPHSSFLYP